MNTGKYYTVKHVYSDHAYNEVMLIKKRLGIPGKHSIFFCHRSWIERYHAYNEVFLKPLGIQDHTF